MTPRFAVAWLVVLFALVLAPLARAAEGSRAIGLAGESAGVIADRLRAELGARGFEVRTIEAFEPGAPWAPDLAAVLRIEEAARRVEIWTPGGDGGAARLRTAVAARADADDTLPVRAAEDVRAYLRGADRAALAAPPATAKPDEEIPRAPPEAGRRFSLGCDAALLVPTGPSTGGGAVVRARYEILDRLALGVRALLPVVPAHVTRDAQETTIAVSAAGLEGYWRLIRGSEWELGAAGGVALAWIRMNGAASAPYIGRRDDVWTSLPYGAVEIARTLARGVRARAGVLVGVAAPGVTVRFAGDPVASWGAPLAALTLGADLDL
jgi:hypothetical protein